MKYIILEPCYKSQIHSIIRATTNTFIILITESHSGTNFQSIISFKIFSLSASDQYLPMELTKDNNRHSQRFWENREGSIWGVFPPDRNQFSFQRNPLQFNSILTLSPWSQRQTPQV